MGLDVRLVAIDQNGAILESAAVSRAWRGGQGDSLYINVCCAHREGVLTR